MFHNKVIVITGGAGGIGKCIAEEFEKNGAHVCVIDTAPGGHYVGDIADKDIKAVVDEKIKDIKKLSRMEAKVVQGSFSLEDVKIPQVFSSSFVQIVFPTICNDCFFSIIMTPFINYS